MVTNTTTDVNKLVATVFGAVFVLVGLLGFVMDPILGIFQTSLLHNLVHLLSGAALLAAAFIDNGRNARMGLLVLGVVYALVTVLGFFAPDLVNTLLGGTATELALDQADNFLHLILAAALIAVPLLFKGDAPVARTTTRV
jgi:uncharacterized membrane protein HdeD (DUF308 family)